MTVFKQEQYRGSAIGISIAAGGKRGELPCLYIIIIIKLDVIKTNIVLDVY